MVQRPSRRSVRTNYVHAQWSRAAPGDKRQVKQKTTRALKQSRADVCILKQSLPKYSRWVPAEMWIAAWKTKWKNYLQVQSKNTMGENSWGKRWKTWRPDPGWSKLTIMEVLEEKRIDGGEPVIKKQKTTHLSWKKDPSLQIGRSHKVDGKTSYT